jgi:ABC-type transport system substrate-binding protein
LDKESIPRWAKFLQGYYDQSGISSDSFDQAIKIDADGNPLLTKAMQAKRLRLRTSVSIAIFYMGFNMLDDVVGGMGESQRKLRQAIAIALDYEEFIAIFLNGRGVPASGPLPPGLFGYPGNYNPYVYEKVQGQIQRKSVAAAKQLLAEAGYPNGLNPKTGQPLVLNLDVSLTSAPEEKAMFDWLREQFAKINIDLQIRATLYNQFQEKMRNGNTQLFSWGWQADYPDPENFLFLLYGPNGKVKFGGENAANYFNPTYDRLFEQMKNMPNTPERQQLIGQMIAIVQHDSPWVFGFFPKDFALSQQWVSPNKPADVINNILKYQRIDPKLRQTIRVQWNQPIIWPLVLFVVLLIIAVFPLYLGYRAKVYRSRGRIRGQRTEDRGQK